MSTNHKAMKPKSFDLTFDIYIFNFNLKSENVAIYLINVAC